MHGQALVIYPDNIKLDKVMEPYQEVDKVETEAMVDYRCQFMLAIPENEYLKH